MSGDNITESLNVTGEALPTVEFLGVRVSVLETSIVMMVHAVVCIIAGVRMGLKTEEHETMSKEDALKFPIMASCTLLGIYLLVKKLRQDLLQVLLKIYFVGVGVFCVAQAVRPIFEIFLVPRDEAKKNESVLLKRKKFFNIIEVDLIDVIAIVTVGLPLMLIWAFTGSWISNNLIGICMTISMISMLNIGSYKTAAMLLGGLFLYDIFWVFGTNVMVSVVRGFDAPIKIVWPRSGLLAPLLTQTAASKNLSMLGLGDIAIPGFFISLMMHFDLALERAAKKDDKIQVPKNCFYYHTSLAAYVLALITTFIAMHLSGHAQPALLYIVPYLLISSVGLAFIRGDFNQLWAFTEEKPEDEGEKRELAWWEKILDFLGIWKAKKTVSKPKPQESNGGESVVEETKKTQ